MNQVYAFQNTPEEVMKSSSGGAFIALCRAFERKHAGQVVFCGAAFDEKLNVVHSCVKTVMECEIFKGSKYVKSRCDFRKLEFEKYIEAGKYILFSGTPCQVFSLNQYIKNHELPRDRFLTIDVICHGTPKVEFWNAYKTWLENKNKSALVAYSFRYKLEGWKAYPAFAQFENKKVIVNTAETSVYSKMHMERYSISKGCFSCPFSKEERISDITLGDYWGVEHVFPEVKYKSGVSLMIVHSDQGVEIVEKIECNRDVFLKKTTDRTYLQFQHNLNSPTECPERYSEFWTDFSQLSFEKLLKKYIGYGKKYRMIYQIKKIARKTPLIEWYRNRR